MALGTNPSRQTIAIFESVVFWHPKCALVGHFIVHLIVIISALNHNKYNLIQFKLSLFTLVIAPKQEVTIRPDRH